MNESSDPLLHQVLAAPLAALVRAEAMSALALLDFVTSVGMQPAATPGAAAATEGTAPSSLGALRMVSFSYQRQQADGTLRQQTMQVPVLALIQLPVLNIKDSSFSFNLALTAIRASTKKAKTVAPGLKRPAGGRLTPRRPGRPGAAPATLMGSPVPASMIASSARLTLRTPGIALNRLRRSP